MSGVDIVADALQVPELMPPVALFDGEEASRTSLVVFQRWLATSLAGVKEK